MAKKIIQKNYEELKEKSEITKRRIRFIDQLELDYKNAPPTEKGMERELNKLIKKLEKKEKKEKKRKN